MQVKIIFNRTNIDSCYASMMLRKALRITADKTKQLLNLQMVNFSKIDQVSITPDAEIIYIVGASIDTHKLIELSNTSKLIFFGYKDSLETARVIHGLKDSKAYTPNFLDGEVALTVEDTLDNSMVKIMNYFIKETIGYDIYSDAVNNDVEIKLVDAITNYINFSTRLTEEELILLFANYEAIYYDVKTTKSFTPISPNSDKGYKVLNSDAEPEPLMKLHDMGRFQIARNLIGRNVASTVYGTQSKSIMIPTACVSEEHALDVMRMMSYPYNLVVTYEDVKHMRVWRIYSKDPAMVQKACEYISHHERWQDNKVTYLLAPLTGVK
jgi:hypothetical protein